MEGSSASMLEIKFSYGLSKIAMDERAGREHKTYRRCDHVPILFESWHIVAAFYQLNGVRRPSTEAKDQDPRGVSETMRKADREYSTDHPAPKNATTLQKCSIGRTKWSALHMTSLLQYSNSSVAR